MEMGVWSERRLVVRAVWRTAGIWRSEVVMRGGCRVVGASSVRGVIESNASSRTFLFDPLLRKLIIFAISRQVLYRNGTCRKRFDHIFPQYM